MQVTITAVDWTDPDGVTLRARQAAEYADDDDGRGSGHGHADPVVMPSAGDVGVFLLARDRASGTAVACGALRHLDPAGAGRAAEITRMFVVPEHRGRGLARLLLAELELQARALGWLSLCLQAGDLRPETLTLFLDAGYEKSSVDDTAADLRASLRLAKQLEAA